MPTFTASKLGYGNLWDRSRPTRVSEAAKVAAIIYAHKKDYKEIGDPLRIPYYTIAAKHYRESNLNFTCHLHEGSPLSNRTKFVPKGRPVTGNPPFTFKQSATDALSMSPHQLNLVTRYSLERTLYEDERYNGWGYIGKGNTPYVWSGTSIYSGGKYVADHVYSQYAQDKQLGTAVIYMELAKLDPEVARALKDREATPPKDVVDDQVSKQTEKEKRIGAGAAAESSATGATKATVEAPKGFSVVHGILLPAAIGMGLAIVICCIISYVRKRKSVPVLVNEKWASATAAIDHPLPKVRKKRRVNKSSKGK